jgi:hypothetical protein
MSPNDDVIVDAPFTAGTSERWTVTIRDNGEASNIVVNAVCADFPPLR